MNVYLKLGQVVYCMEEGVYARIDNIRVTAGGKQRYSLDGSIGTWYSDRDLRGLTARELGL